MELGKQREEFRVCSFLFLFAYAFLLRLPSEALPARASKGDYCLVKEGNFMVCALKRRKNKPEGSRIARGCWCSESPTTCPLCVLGPYVASKNPGEMLWSGLTAAGVLRTLREMLELLGVQNARLYRTHDFRRGHAGDLRASGM